MAACGRDAVAPDLRPGDPGTGDGDAPWSPRARPGAGIACPLSRGQVKSGPDPKGFTLRTYSALLKKPDPWKDFRAGAVNLKPLLKTVL